MSKISVTELASVLIDKHGLKRTEAELFIRQFVNVVNDGLKADKSVKVKGLGTFKVLSVSARKSVDVNTGKAIVIEGRDKISFTADSVMRDLVNAPFAQFETVVVNDGVDFSAIDAAHEADNMDQLNGDVADMEQNVSASQSVENVNPVAETPVEAETEVQVETPLPTVEETQPIIEEPLPTIEEPQPTIEEPQPAVEEPLAVSEEPRPVAEPVVETTPIEEKPLAEIVETPAEPEPTVETVEQPVEQQPTVETEHTEVKESVVEPVNATETTEATENIQEETADDDVDEDTTDKLKPYKTTITILAASLAFVVIVGVIGGFYMVSQLEKRDNRIEHLEAQTATLVERMMKTNSSAAKPSAQGKQENVLASEEKVNIISENEKKIEAAEEADKPKAANGAEASKPATTSEPAPKAKEKPQPAVQKPSSIPSQSAYDKDPRVRTGAYVITGIATTVTVKSGQTMSSISKTHLGPGMECYLEAVNGGNRELKVGEKVKIPSLKTKKSLK